MESKVSQDDQIYPKSPIAARKSKFEMEIDFTESPLPKRMVDQSALGGGAYQEQALPKASRRLVAAGQEMLKKDALQNTSIVRFKDTLDSANLNQMLKGVDQQ